jgi:mannose-1-phosphate guanylyltransferase
MTRAAVTWAVVLAAGDGTRLATLTTDASGNSVPKQFCSLNGGSALIVESLQRARHVAAPERVCAIVAQQHAPHWRRHLGFLPRRNVIVQPQNRGTANGILLSVLSILERDPLAKIVFLPADHLVLDENALGRALRDLVAAVSHHPQGLTLVGIEPEEADPELGYVVPGRSLHDGSRTVSRFIEKPAPHIAQELLRGQALWNSFIFGAHAPALLGLLRTHLGASVEDMATALARDAQSNERSALGRHYEQLPTADFSRAIMQRATHVLRVIRAPACGWSDLGTPERVARALSRLSVLKGQHSYALTSGGRFQPAPGAVSLAAQQARLALAG